MGGYVHVFCRSSAALGAGHVAWGFEAVKKKNGTRLYYYGSYDNNDNDEGGLKVWYDYGPGEQMVTYFLRSEEYDGWKYLWVSNAKLEPALEAQRKWINRYYCAFGSNCLNTVYDILKAYGTPILPQPLLTLNWRPKDWFASFQGNKGQLKN